MQRLFLLLLSSLVLLLQLSQRLLLLLLSSLVLLSQRLLLLLLSSRQSRFMLLHCGLSGVQRILQSRSYVLLTLQLRLELLDLPFKVRNGLGVRSVSLISRSLA